MMNKLEKFNTFEVFEIMPFSKWLQIKETATSTADVAGYKRMIIPGPITRGKFGPWGEEDAFFKKKNKKTID